MQGVREVAVSARVVRAVRQRGGGRGGAVLLYERGRNCCVGYGWPGLRIRLVQPQAKVHAQKGGVRPEDIRPVSRHPAMRSIEVEQDVLLEGRNKYDGGYGEKNDPKTNANTNCACLF